MTESEQYPEAINRRNRWQQLAKDIASDESNHGVVKNTDSNTGPKGRLTILGSGIGVMSFTRDAEDIIRDADQVFHCVADPATKVWLNELRPDSYDLYVFYDDDKPRYHTYIQMTEAMLHYVRRGQNVVTIFYGHPGVFALSPHRAIAIAKQEGHIAVMKPGISALDCLCADLGVDPAFPGLQTFEATDLLLRRRSIDISSHVVLWQVGLVGEMGYRRKGFINEKFPMLVRYLQSFYGEDYEVTHYIASRYPTLPPLIEQIRLSDFNKNNRSEALSGISTFYIPPKQARKTDKETAVSLGLMNPESTLKEPSRLRTIDAYGHRETKAIAELDNFHVPDDYVDSKNTAAAHFLLALKSDQPLQRAYERDPQKTVDNFPGLSAKEKRLLASRDSMRVQVAAKGLGVTLSADEQFIVDLLSKPSLAKSFNNELIKDSSKSNAFTLINAWIASQGYSGVDFEKYPAAASGLSQSLLLPWSGIYASGGDNVDVLYISGNPSGNATTVIYFNLTRISGFSYSNGILSWDDSKGKNGNSANLNLIMPPGSAAGFIRSVSGKIWTGSTPPASDNFQALEILPPQNPLTTWAGEYPTQVSSDNVTWAAGPKVTVFKPEMPGEQPYLMVDTFKVTDYVFQNKTLSWDSNKNFIQFEISTDQPATFMLSGRLDGHPYVKSTASATYSTPYQGQYVCQTKSSKNVWNTSAPLFLNSEYVVIGYQLIKPISYSNRILQWSDVKGAGDVANGYIQFSVNPYNQATLFQGYVWGATATKPTSINIQGSASPNYLQMWSGTYSSTLNNVAGPTLQILPGTGGTKVLYNGKELDSYAMKASVLEGKLGSTSFQTVMYHDVANNMATRNFSGHVTVGSSPSEEWKSTSLSADITVWVGSYTTQTLDSNGSMVSGPVIEITSADAKSFTVVLHKGSISVTLTNPSFVMDKDSPVLSWQNNTGTPDSNSYAFGAITFIDNVNLQSKQFAGSFWPTSGSAPVKSNWIGSIQQYGMVAGDVQSAQLQSLVRSNSVQATASSEQNDGYYGEYLTQQLVSDSWQDTSPMFFDGKNLQLGHQEVSDFVFANNELSWNNTDSNGALTFTSDVSSGAVSFTGCLWSSGSKPSTSNFKGMLSLDFVQTWAGSYSTTLDSDTGTPLVIQTSSNGATTVSYGSNAVQYSFAGQKMQGWIDANTGFEITYSISVASGDNITRKFSGTLVNGTTSTSWTGKTTASGSSDSGGTSIAKIIGGVIGGIIGLAIVVGGIAYVWRARAAARNAYNRVSTEQEMAVCKKKN